MNTFICLLQAEVVFSVFCGHLKQLVIPARALAFGPGGAGQGRRSKEKSCDVSGQGGQAARWARQNISSSAKQNSKGSGGLGHQEGRCLFK